ncbi:phosphopantothenate--cysteine ligase [Streptococcus moroccensis]|uniref:Phosphopantothenate-cysteine ligase n=1 Tax=Streptococcus moroccensis TaxID=1451356 RepID=A0ABT9YPE8_9STRE|nr:phosphopantothenate--cysteine ligase [Streptococcus moroccensis]MDQ0221762.1 phosphopantothenate-cysteine ligase [Streptococcus moroccensis]
MKIIITSGGTSEAIDSVRDITNKATGRLGQVMAERFLEAGHHVTFVTTKHALKPQPHDRLTLHLITNVTSLMETLEPLVKTHDAIIHAMAVSDYTPVYMTDFETVSESNDLSQFLTAHNAETKISSSADYQVLFLKKTPKVISKIKKWNPAIHLIGFKLLVAVSQQELFEVARASLIKNKADAIVANDLTEISADSHKAYLVTTSEAIQTETKQGIAEMVLTFLKQIEDEK